MHRRGWRQHRWEGGCGRWDPWGQGLGETQRPHQRAWGRRREAAGAVFSFSKSAFASVTLRILFCRQANLGSRQCLDSSKYQSKQTSCSVLEILTLLLSNLALRNASLGISKVPCCDHWYRKLFSVRSVHLAHAERHDFKHKTHWTFCGRGVHLRNCDSISQRVFFFLLKENKHFQNLQQLR